jgi:hypothetical protein
MAWSTPSTRTTGTLITAAIWNQDAVDNPIALRAGAIAIASQANGRVVLASSATQLTTSRVFPKVFSEVFGD